MDSPLLHTKEYNLSLKDDRDALRRFTDFMLYGKIPPDAGEDSK
jgi:hypothetical protein